MACGFIDFLTHCKRRLRGSMVSVALVCAALAPGAVCQPAGIAEFEAWVRHTFPDWRDDQVGTVVVGVASALEEYGAALGAEGQALLLDAAHDMFNRRFPPDRIVVPADLPYAVEAFRFGVERYAGRDPMTAEERTTLEAQLTEVYNYANELLASSPIAKVESAHAMMETFWEEWRREMDNPLAFELTKPFTEEEMATILERMAEEAGHFTAVEGMRPEDVDARAERMVSRLMGPVGEVSYESVPPIPERMTALSQIASAQQFEAQREAAHQDAARRAKERDRLAALEQDAQRIVKAYEDSVARENAAPEPSEGAESGAAPVSSRTSITSPDAAPEPNARRGGRAPRLAGGLVLVVCLAFAGGLLVGRGRR